MSRNAVDYEKDFYAWTMEQARLLRSGELSAVDIENIAEEIESIGGATGGRSKGAAERVPEPASHRLRNSATGLCGGARGRGG